MGDSGLGLRLSAGSLRTLAGASSNAASAPVALSAAFTEYDESCEVDKTDDNNDNAETNEDEEFWEEELPVISIELQPLVGYKPSTAEEIESIKKQIVHAMWERYRSTNQSSSEDGKEQKEKTEEEQQQEEDEPPPDFDDQIKELLESRVARFGSVDNTNGDSDVATTSNDDNDSNKALTPSSPFLEITYPSRILPPNASSDRQTSEDTARMWSVVRGLAYTLEDETEYREEDGEGTGNNANNDLEFLWHLADHLEHTGRLLWWKYNMALELRDMLFRANLPRKHELWVREQRKAKLEQLYQVRETLVHRKEVASEDFALLVAQKETAVRKDLLLYDHNVKRNKRNRNSNGDSLFGGGELSFPEQFELMGLLPKDSQLYEEEDWGGTLDDDDDFDYYNSDYSNYSDDDEDDYSDGELSGFSGDGEADSDHEREDLLPPVVPTNGETRTTITSAAAGGDEANRDGHPVVTKDDGATAPPTGTVAGTTTAAPNNSVWKRNRKRRQKKARAKMRKEQAEAQRREELEKRKEHEDFLEAKHTTQKLVLAQTLLEALSKKVDDVEELLENLQDEEWEAAEQAEAGADPKTDGDDDDGEGVSVLHQVLAMILGALPMEPGSKDRERHYRYVQKEHRFILRGWKEYFGELPPPLQRSSSSSSSSNETTETPPTPPLPTGEQPAPPAGNDEVPPVASPAIAAATTNAAPTTATTTPREQRMALGIVDNDENDWDAMADEDEDDG